MFGFNKTVDNAVVKPLARGYRTVTPSPVQTGVNNFFGNLSDVWTTVNQFLQGRPKEGFSDMMRVFINTTFGLGGVLDIATPGQLTKHNEDFGQTLGEWGFGPGPYVVLPFFGPSTARDSVAMPIDVLGDPWYYKYPVNVFNSGIVLRTVDDRANLLDTTDLVGDIALDEYTFVRDAYLQRRASQIQRQFTDAPDSSSQLENR